MSKKGLTSIEWLIVVSIIGIIIAITLPLILPRTTPAPHQSQGAIKFEKIDGALIASYDMSTVETIGNHSWIPLNIDKNTGEREVLPSEYRLFILGALLAFEKEYPHLEITNWRIERDQGANHPKAWNAKIYGLWIDHKPREQK